MTECAFIECGDPANTYRHIITLRNGSCHNRLDHCFMVGSLSMGMGVNVGKEDTRNTDNRPDYKSKKKQWTTVSRGGTTWSQRPRVSRRCRLQ